MIGRCLSVYVIELQPQTPLARLDSQHKPPSRAHVHPRMHIAVRAASPPPSIPLGWVGAASFDTVGIGGRARSTGVHVRSVGMVGGKTPSTKP